MASFVKRFLSVALLMAGLAIPGAAQANKKVYRSLLPSTTWVTVPGLGSGSGVLVDKSKRLVVTNYHVVRDRGTAYVYFPTYSAGRLVTTKNYYTANKATLAIRGTVISRAKSKDLAIIQLDRLPTGAREAPMARNSVEPAETVHVIGNQVGTGAMWLYTHGKVRQVLNSRHNILMHDRSIIRVNARVVITNLATNPGDSGGPVVNDKGELVALVSSSQGKVRLVSTFIDISEIRNVVSSARKGPEMVRRTPSPTPSPVLPTPPAEEAKKRTLTPTPTPPAGEAKQRKIMGVWSGKSTSRTGASIGWGMVLSADGKFTIATNSSDGKKTLDNGTFVYSNNKLTMYKDGRVFASNWLTWNGNNRFHMGKVSFVRVTGKGRPARISLAGTSWTGKETLPGYGKLTFQFKAGGKVVMIDARAVSNGTYTLKGNRVTLNFGGTIYSGTIAGRSMSGSAFENAGQRRSWTFSISRS